MICEDLRRLIDYAEKSGVITRDDEYVVRNRLMEALGLREWMENEAEYGGVGVERLLAPLISHAVESV